ncbi:hypothetical protein DC31_05320 [Microbacterium sp. CH12i]|uniref:hypothetical protein n=1 Tax=Microbacterium sp. CH12i TaxID=1479651 RepID=UPI000461D701|nr:hypothetical protein [Microbacterium sp. CH12i]KDA04719.1 hypothetical protein DC31_05320 [Microbacterium sp. CH12i]
MGLFQQRPDEEQQDWTGLPSEPLEADTADTLGAGPAIDPLSIGLGASVSSIAFPVTLPAPDAESIETGEPDGDE